jgi:hypothetical protein
LRLVRFALNWITIKRDELHNLLGKKYEQIPYEELLSLPDVMYQAPMARRGQNK